MFAVKLSVKWVVNGLFFSPGGLAFHLCDEGKIHIHITVEIQKCIALYSLLLISIG